MNGFVLSVALLLAAYIALHYWSVYKPAAEGDRGAPQAHVAWPDVRESRSRSRQPAIPDDLIEFISRA